MIYTGYDTSPHTPTPECSGILSSSGLASTMVFVLRASPLGPLIQNTPYHYPLIPTLFLKHYRDTYRSPHFPTPLWGPPKGAIHYFTLLMNTLEVISGNRSLEQPLNP